MSKETNSIVSILTGIAIGTVIGILIAPEKGKKTRKKIVREASKLKKKIDEEIENLDAKESLHKTKDKISKEIDNLLNGDTKEDLT